MTDRPTVPPAAPHSARIDTTAPADRQQLRRPTGRPTLRHRLARLVTGRPQPNPTTDTLEAHSEPVALRIGLPVAVWTLSAITSMLAATGQIGFARWAGVTDWRRFLVPAGLELVAGAFMLLGYRRARRGHSPALMWAFACLIGLFAIYTNVVHAGPRAGLLFGAATAITLLLWFAKLYDDYRDFRELIDEDGLGLLWATNTRLAFRALLVSKRLRVRKVTHMLAFAEVWIAVLDDARQAGVKGWRLRRRTAWRSVMKAAGHPVAELPTFATVDRVSVVDQPAPKRPAPAAEPTRSADRLNGGPTRPATVKAAPGRRSASHLRSVWSPTVVANAAELRRRYGTDLPSDYQVRKDTGWSYDRATPAIKAYRAGADLEDDTKEDAA